MIANLELKGFFSYWIDCDWKRVLNGDHGESDIAFSWNVLFWIIIFVFGKCTLLVFFFLTCMAARASPGSKPAAAAGRRTRKPKSSTWSPRFPWKKRGKENIGGKEIVGKGSVRGNCGIFDRIRPRTHRKELTLTRMTKGRFFWESIKGKGKEASHFPTKRSPSPSSAFTRNCAVLVYSCSGRG